MGRARSALVFALIVAGVQTACLTVLAAAGWLPETPGARRGDVKPLLQLASFIAVLVFPSSCTIDLAAAARPRLLHGKPRSSCHSSACSSATLLVGVLVENGYAGPWAPGPQVGAVFGSFVAVFVFEPGLDGT